MTLGMNRNVARREFVAAEEAVREGRDHLEQQRAAIRRLRNAGRDTTVAQALLDTFTALQDQDEHRRDCLKRELEAADAEHSH
jgi:hypothetical protein